MSSVTAVIVGPPLGGPPAGVADVAGVSLLCGVTRAARAARTPLVWLLDGAAAPEPGALAALLEHAGEGPAASLPVGPGGAPVGPLLGRFRDGDPAEAIDTVARRCVPLAHVPVVSLLVEREAVAAATAPAGARLGPYAGTAWTAGLFAGRRALLVTASRVRAPEPPAGTPAQALRMARTGVWGRAELVRELRRALTG